MKIFSTRPYGMYATKSCATLRTRAHVGAATDSTGNPTPSWFPLFVVGGIFTLIGVAMYLQVKGKLPVSSGPVYPFSPYPYYEPGLTFRIS